MYKDEHIGNLRYVKIDSTTTLLAQILQMLYINDINSLLVEGGSATLQAFIDEGLWDEARIITNNNLNICDGLQAPVLSKAGLVKTESFLQDSITYFTRETEMA